MIDTIVPLMDKATKHHHKYVELSKRHDKHGSGVSLETTVRAMVRSGKIKTFPKSVTDLLKIQFETCDSGHLAVTTPDSGQAAYRAYKQQLSMLAMLVRWLIFADGEHKTIMKVIDGENTPMPSLDAVDVKHHIKLIWIYDEMQKINAELTAQEKTKPSK